MTRRRDPDNYTIERDPERGEQYVRMELSRGEFAKFDLIDLPYVQHFRWYAEKKRQGFYAVTRIYQPGGKGKSLFFYMHNIILGRQDGVEVDHINEDKLDNRRFNLRHVTRSMNRSNRAAAKINSKSGVRGVFEYHGPRWHAWRFEWNIDRHRYVKDFPLTGEGFLRAKAASEAYYASLKV